MRKTKGCSKIFSNGKRQAYAEKIYAKTREECEEKLAELIKVTKAETAEMKAKATV